MNKWIIRSLLLVSLLASVTIRATLGNYARSSVNINDAVLHLMAIHGFSYDGTTRIEGGALNAMLFHSPSCGRPIQIVPTSSYFEGRSLFDHIGASGDGQKFAYLSQVWRREDRLGIFFEHVKHRTLELIGITPYQPDHTMVMISEPKGCDIASRIDWSILWEMDYRSRMARQQAPTTQQSQPAITSEAPRE
jgi:hypothetical protein